MASPSPRAQRWHPDELGQTSRRIPQAAYQAPVQHALRIARATCGQRLLNVIRS